MGIKLRTKKLKGGRESLYLDCCYQNKRHKEYLQLILEPPTSVINRSNNSQKLKVAELIRSKREIEIAFEKFGQSSNIFLTKTKAKKNPQSSDFLLIYKQYVRDYHRKDIRTVEASLKYLLAFVKKSAFSLSNLDKTFCKEFYEYLCTQLRGTTPHSYFQKFKTCLANCVEAGLIDRNPAAYIKVNRQEEITKQILTTEELCQLAISPCADTDVKRAFLFACNTGLRWCDVVLLTYQQLDTENQMLHLTQSKVKLSSKKAVLHLVLNQTAWQLITARSGNPEEKIFKLPSYNYMLRILGKWTQDAGVKKHITFHCARHTFITHIMRQGANIKTAAELAGHSTTKYTEKYIHIMDDLKRKAVENLPELPVFI